MMWPEAQRPRGLVWLLTLQSTCSPAIASTPNLALSAPLHTLQPFLGAPRSELSFPPRPSPPRRPHGAAQAHGGGDCCPSDRLSLTLPHAACKRHF